MAHGSKVEQIELISNSKEKTPQNTVIFNIKNQPGKCFFNQYFLCYYAIARVHCI